MKKLVICTKQTKTKELNKNKTEILKCNEVKRFDRTQNRLNFNESIFKGSDENGDT